MPNLQAGLMEGFENQVFGDFLKRSYILDAQLAERFVGFPAYAGDGFDRQGRQKSFFRPVLHEFLSGRLCHSGSNFTDGLVGRKSKTNRQTGFSFNFLLQFLIHFPTSKKTIHARQINVEFVNAAFLVKRHRFCNDFGHHLRIFTVQLRIAPNVNGIRTKHSGLLHRHGAVHPKFPSLIAATGHHTSVTHAANNQWPSLKRGILQPLHTHKK